MNINAASNASDLWQLLQSSQTHSANAVSPTSGTNTSSVTSSSYDGSSLSTAAKVFSKLHELSQSNPAEFEKISAQIATQLQQAAASATDPAQASALNQLAANFQNAAKSGSFNDLFSQSGSITSTSHSSGHHHHYHPDEDGDGTGSSATSSSTSATQNASDALSAIFANALSQIQNDLKSSTSSTTVTL